MIYFGSDRQKSEFNFLSFRLRAIFYMISAIASEKFKCHVIVTDCLRSKHEDNELGGVGIHPTGRALDFNLCTETRVRLHDTQQTDALLEFVNTLIPYGSGRYKTLVYHNVKGLHFHLQVSWNKSTEILEVTC